MMIKIDDTHTRTARLEVEGAIDSDLGSRAHEGDSLGAQATISGPGPDEGGSERRGNPHDKDPKLSHAQPERTIDATSILGRYPVDPTPCPLCCVVVDRISLKWVLPLSHLLSILTGMVRK